MDNEKEPLEIDGKSSSGSGAGAFVLGALEGEGYAPPESLRISAEMTFEEEEED